MDRAQDLGWHEAIEQAAENLPEGWSICLTVEKGCAWVDMYDDNGSIKEFEDSSITPLQQFMMAVTTHKHLWR